MIGCGRIGAEVFNYRKEMGPATHAGAYQGHPRIKLVGLVDTNQKKLNLASKYFPGISLFASAEEMFRNIKPDIVSVATHSDSHLPLVKLAAKFGTRAIVCEKPIAGSLKEAKEMIKICRENKSLLFINHQRRFDPLVREWRGRVKNGLIGDILQSNSFYCNGLFNNGTHIIDLLRFFLGEVDWLRAVTNEKTSWNKNDKNVDALIRFKNGARVVLQSLPKNYDFLDQYFYGSRGRIVIKDLNCQIEHRKLIKSQYYQGYYQLFQKPRFYGKIRSFMLSMADHIVNCLDGKEKPVSRGEDGLAALKILFALRKSAENKGQLIRIK